jgi:type I restriction enzyme R subunit
MPLDPANTLGTATPQNIEDAFLSAIIRRLNEVFDTEKLTPDDMVNYAHTIKDKIRENAQVMAQIKQNTREQAMLGDFPRAIDDAILESGDAHQNQMMQLLSDPSKAAHFQKVIFDLVTRPDDAPR